MSALPEEEEEDPIYAIRPEAIPRLVEPPGIGGIREPIRSEALAEPEVQAAEVHGLGKEKPAEWRVGL